MTHTKQIKIDDTDVFLENYGVGNGKITISDSYNHNYSYHWGGMGSDIEKFLLSISSDYFADKLIPAWDERVIDLTATFKNLRAFIREELELPFYKEMEFQKDMRLQLKSFQANCQGKNGKYLFVEDFQSDFIKSLNFNLIENRFDKSELKKNFEGIDEPWHFLVEKPSANYEWLIKFHSKLQKKLKP